MPRSMAYAERFCPAKGVDMATALLQISDLHVGSDPVHTKRAADLVERIVAKWGHSANRPAVVITGDIVNDGAESQYQDAKQIIGRLRSGGFQTICLPGNHDYGRAGYHAEAKRFELFKQYIADPATQWRYPNCIRLPGWAIISLDSMQSECGFWDGLFADGELGGAQIAEVAGMLAALVDERATGLRVAVCLHHHPFLFPDDPPYRSAYEKLAHRLKDGDAWMKTLAGSVDALLFGHEHRHVNFAETFPNDDLPKKYGIPTILSCGSSTASDRGVGWLIGPQETGGVSPKSVDL